MPWTRSRPTQAQMDPWCKPCDQSGIVRVFQVLQLLRLDRLALGAQLFLMGFVKKTFIADRIAGFVDPVFGQPSAFDSATNWLALLGYSLQIFCDFSGYSDMAIGVAVIFGYRLVEN